jgi:hypothetical protein
MKQTDSTGCGLLKNKHLDPALTIHRSSKLGAVALHEFVRAADARHPCSILQPLKTNEAHVAQLVEVVCTNESIQQRTGRSARNHRATLLL